MKDMLQVLKRNSLLEDFSDDFTDIGMHDLWHEFAVLECESQDFRDIQWVYYRDGKRAMQRSGQGRECVKRMCFLDEGWRGLQGLNLADFENVEAFVLSVSVMTRDCSLDLDLRRLKHLKSLRVETSELAVRVDGLKSLTNLVCLSWSMHGFLPCLDKIGRLRNLHYLELKYCKGVKVLDLTELTFLQAVRIGDIPDLITLRGFSSRMANLRSLGVWKCKLLQECLGLDELLALKVLRVGSCGKLKRLPWLGQLTKLTELFIGPCKSLESLQGLSDLVGLEEITISFCSNLAALPTLVKLTRLQKLDILGCPLHEGSGLDDLIALTSLCACFSWLMREPPNLSKLEMLKILGIVGLIGPIWASIQNLMMLEELSLFNCKGEDVVPDLQNLKRLRMVFVFKCNMTDISGLSNSTALKYLKIYKCKDLERLLDFDRLTKLRTLDIRGCENIRGWPSASNFCSVKELSVDRIAFMKIAPDLKLLTGLQELDLHGHGCENVLSMVAISQLESIGISHCITMEALDLTIFPQSKALEIRWCRALQRVSCSIPLTALTRLEVIGCYRLVEIPDLSLFPALENLTVRFCEALPRLTCSTSLAALRNIYLSSGIEVPDLIREVVQYSVDEDSVDEDLVDEVLLDEDLVDAPRRFRFCCC